MNKEKQIQKIKSEKLIEELSKMPPMVIATAYLHAINYTLYGVDVTEKWLTATQQAFALEHAHRKAYYEALQRHAESEEEPKTGHWIPASERLPEEGQWVVVTYGGKLAVCRAQDDEGALQEVPTEIWFYPEPGWGDGYSAWMPLPEPYQSND